MKIINRTILKQFLLVFIFSLLALVMILLLSSVFEVSNTDVTGRDWIFLQFVLYSIPNLWLLALPFALLYAGIFVMAKYKQENMIIILQSSGIEFWRIIYPILLVAFFLLSSNG